jgi:hypothetical protein
MELIPVFAFIVLVATIATFIFALAAYILFKVREKRGKYQNQPHSEAFKAELVTPNYYYLPPSQKQDGSREYINSYHTKNIRFQDNGEPNLNIPEENNSLESNYGKELVWK